MNSRVSYLINKYCNCYFAGVMPHVPRMLPVLISDPEMREKVSDTFTSQEFMDNLEGYFVDNIKVYTHKTVCIVYNWLYLLQKKNICKMHQKLWTTLRNTTWGSPSWTVPTLICAEKSIKFLVHFCHLLIKAMTQS